MSDRIFNDLLDICRPALTLPPPPPPLPEMLESSNLVTFNGLANSSSYDAFLLDEERGRLLVGAEDHLFSFDLVNINRDMKQVKVRCTQVNCGNSFGLFCCPLLSSPLLSSPLLSSGVHYTTSFSPLTVSLSRQGCP